MATTNVRTPWQDLAQYQQIAGRQLDVEDVIAQLQEALKPANLSQNSPKSPPWAQFGHAAVDPYHTTFVEPTMYSNAQYKGQMQKQLSAALSEQAINNAAMELFSPYTPPAARTPGNASPRLPSIPGTPGGVPKSAILGPLSILVDLLTHSGDTNSNEKDKLAEKQGPAYTNKPEYEKLLQQALQQLQSGGGKP